MTGRFIFVCCKPYMSKGQQRYKIVLFSPENNDIEQCFCNFSYEGSMGDVVLCRFEIQHYGKDTRLQLSAIRQEEGK